MTLSINSNLSANLAGLNIGNATTSVQNNVQALASGNRIVKASTDVTALSIGTSLNGQVSALTTALSISSQATSLLQVADGALSQIQSILQQMQTIATSAQAGDLSSTQRGFLNTEFQDLSSQIDQLSSSTNFNGVQLINGSIAGGSTINSNANAGNGSAPIASNAIMTVTTAALNAGDTMTVNGVSFTLKTTGGTDYSGATTADTAANLAALLNNSGAAALSNYRFAASGSTVVSYYTGGVGTPGIGAPGFSASETSTSLTGANATFGLGTKVATIGAVVATDTVTINGVTLTAGTEFAVGGTSAATATNLVNYLNSTSNAAWAGISFVTDPAAGADIYAYYSGTTSPSITTAASAHVTNTVTGSSLNTLGTNGLSAGSTSAVGTVSGQGLFVTDSSNAVTNWGQAVDLFNINSNSAFVGQFGGSGTIGAIKATYNGGASPSVSFSVTVGNDTYTSNAIAVSSLTNATQPTAIAFYGKNTTSGASEGGNFTLNIQGGQASITNQQGADNLASAMNADLSTVSAYQNRNVLSYNNNYTAQVGSTITGVLTGSSVSWNSNQFSNPLISSVSVSAPGTGETDAKISVVINGDTYSTQAGIGSTLATDKVFTLVNQNNPNQTIQLTTGNTAKDGTTGTGKTAVDLTTASNAAAFQTALSNAFGISSSNAALTFQVGSTSSASIGVSLQSASTSTLFGGQSLDVSTAADAATAYTAVSSAIDTIGAYRASVGALQLEFQYASAAAQSSQQNESAAASSLLDTDVASTSTAYATAQVQLQAGIAVLAQANQLQQDTLKLFQ